MSRTRFEPIVDLLVQSSAISQRLRRAPISDEAVMSRCLNAAVNAAFAMSHGRGAPTLDDIDAIWLDRLGFPRWKGGLIHHARTHGLEVVVAELSAAAARRNTAGAPCEPLIAAANRGGARLAATETEQACSRRASPSGVAQSSARAAARR